MRTIIALILIINLAACSTSAGLVKGLGEDIKAGTDWTASKIKSNQ
jgi:predicted small secreted protein